MNDRVEEELRRSTREVDTNSICPTPIVALG